MADDRYFVGGLCTSIKKHTKPVERCGKPLLFLRDKDDNARTTLLCGECDSVGLLPAAVIQRIMGT